MTRRKQYAAHREPERKPRSWALRLVVFLSVVTICGGLTVGLLTLTIGTGGRLSGVDIEQLGSLEQIAVELYLRIRQSDLDSRPPGTGSVAFSIQPGDTAGTVGARLERLGLITDGELFRLLARARGVGARLEVGDYQLQRGMTMEEVLLALQSGRIKPVIARVIEGWRIEEVAAALEAQGVIAAHEYIKAAKAGPYAYAFLDQLPSGTTLEGFLYPDTYQVPSNATGQQVVDLMLRNFNSRFAAESWSKPQAPGLSPYQLLIIASIVEREARKPEERPIIASVYINRLKHKMRLEADPTVQYAMGYQVQTGTWWKTPVVLEEYSTVRHPYNTYLFDGLPPTPICNPSLSAIRAAFEPADTVFLFFVSRGDGTHVFATTFEEHQANIRKFQR